MDNAKYKSSDIANFSFKMNAFFFPIAVAIWGNCLEFVSVLLLLKKDSVVTQSPAV